MHVGRRNRKTGRSFISLEGSFLRPRKQDDAHKKKRHIHVSLFQFPYYIATCHVILNKIELNDSRAIKSCFAKYCRLQGDEGIIVHQVWFPKGLFPLISKHITSYLVKVWIKPYFDLGFILSSFHRFVSVYQCNRIRFGAVGIEPKQYNLSANSYFPWKMFLVNFFPFFLPAFWENEKLFRNGDEMMYIPVTNQLQDQYVALVNNYLSPTYPFAKIIQRWID